MEQPAIAPSATNNTVEIKMPAPSDLLPNAHQTDAAIVKSPGYTVALPSQSAVVDREDNISLPSVEGDEPETPARHPSPVFFDAVEPQGDDGSGTLTPDNWSQDPEGAEEEEEAVNVENGCTEALSAPLPLTRENLEALSGPRDDTLAEECSVTNVSFGSRITDDGHPWVEHSTITPDGKICPWARLDEVSGRRHGVGNRCKWQRVPRGSGYAEEPMPGVPELVLTTPEEDGAEEFNLVDPSQQWYEWDYFDGRFHHYCVDTEEAEWEAALEETRRLQEDKDDEEREKEARQAPESRNTLTPDSSLSQPLNLPAIPSYNPRGLSWAELDEEDDEDVSWATAPSSPAPPEEDEGIEMEARQTAESRDTRTPSSSVSAPLDLPAIPPYNPKGLSWADLDEEDDEDASWATTPSSPVLETTPGNSDSKRPLVPSSPTETTTPPVVQPGPNRETRPRQVSWAPPPPHLQTINEDEIWMGWDCPPMPYLF